VKNDTIKLKNKINDTDKNLIVLENNLIKIKETIIKFKENIKNIEHNKKINSLISEQDKKLSTVINEIKTLDKQIIEINSKVQISESEKKKLLSDMERIKILELKYEAYNYYLEATANDGIPYELVARVIPDLQEEINNILKQIVDFSILLELDGKNVNTRIYYGEDRQWALETGGGMEKFVSSIAIRTALVNFSNLPRPNFLAIDEGFSNQDPEVMNQMPILFEFLRTQFDFVLCISHNMVIKDMVDDVITASKKDEFSYIRYE
jgi:DNA repair exonuclease SbcCD ATPase subunit